MTYVRSKNIKGKIYYYLVKSVRDGNKVHQINLAYLGTEKPTEGEVKKLKKRHEKLSMSLERDITFIPVSSSPSL